MNAAAKPPTGPIAFLFTDIEGSSRLWEQDREAMRRASVRHDAIVRQAAEAHRGYVFKSVGDGFCVAFSAAQSVVSAAVRAQALLASETWPTDSAVRVRMATHCGAADLRDGDYQGPALNRCARIQALALGGQVLVSEATFALTADELPPDVTLAYVGQCALRDLVRPERLCELRHPALASRFPPPRSMDRVPNNLPKRLSRFVGREAEVKAILGLVQSSRLVTIVGAGGTGKTTPLRDALAARERELSLMAPASVKPRLPPRQSRGVSHHTSCGIRLGAEAEGEPRCLDVGLGSSERGGIALRRRDGTDLVQRGRPLGCVIHLHRAPSARHVGADMRAGSSLIVRRRPSRP